MYDISAPLLSLERISYVYLWMRYTSDEKKYREGNQESFTPMQEKRRRRSRRSRKRKKKIS